MHKVIIKISIGCIIGCILFFSIESGQKSLASFILYAIWSIGVIFGFKKGLHVLKSIIDSSFKISIISWISVGTGMVGLFLLVSIILLMLCFGWSYGYYVLYMDLKSYKRRV